MVNFTIEEVTKVHNVGWKQITNQDELRGKVIKNVITEYDDMFILFTDKTYVHYEACGDDNQYDIDLQGKNGRLDSYRKLFDVYYGGKEGYTQDNPHLVLTKLGEAMNADIDTMNEYYKKEKELYETEKESNEYQQYLKLKEKYGSIQS